MVWRLWSDERPRHLSLSKSLGHLLERQWRFVAAEAPTAAAVVISAPTEFTDATHSDTRARARGGGATKAADVNAPTAADLLASEVASEVAATCGRGCGCAEGGRRAMGPEAGRLAASTARI